MSNIDMDKVKEINVRKSERNRIVQLRKALEYVVECANGIRVSYLDFMDAKVGDWDSDELYEEACNAFSEHHYATRDLDEQLTLDRDLRWRFDNEDEATRKAEGIAAPLVPIDRWGGPARKYLMDLGLSSATQLREIVKSHTTKEEA